jgi:hypothetical protein
MKKLLLAIALIVGCESFGVFKHDHDGVCVKMVTYDTNYYHCYPHYTEKDCLEDEQKSDAIDLHEDHFTFSFYNMTCDEFCDIPSSDSCVIITQ